MIAQLTGAIIGAGATWILIEVGGIGYRAHTNAATAAKVRLGETQTIHTSLVVREDSLTLWGFATARERDAFELAQSASGVGPKVAAAMLNVFSPGELRQIITSEDVRRLTTVPGIGPKGAQKIIIELKEKALALDSDDAATSLRSTGFTTWRGEVAEGLETLGWSTKEAERACEAVAHLVDEDPEISIGRLMRAALSTLAKR